MLVLTQRVGFPGDEVIITLSSGETITVRLLECGKGRAKIGYEAGSDVRIMRRSKQESGEPEDAAPRP